MEGGAPPAVVSRCWQRDHWSVTVAVRLVYAFDCSFFSKESLTEEGPNLGVWLLGLEPQYNFKTLLGSAAWLPVSPRIQLSVKATPCGFETW